MTDKSNTRSSLNILWISLAMAILISVILIPAAAQAAPKKCFGKKVNRVVKNNGGKVYLKFKDVTYVSGKNVKVIARPYSRICAGAGRQVIYAGKGWSKTDAGPGDDKIILHRSSSKSRAYGGLGNDRIEGANGHDFLYGGPKSNPGGASDNDTILGLGGNDRIVDYLGENNLFGGTGVDTLFSLGSSVSNAYGGGASDVIWFNGGRSASGKMEHIFGERGNDRMRGDKFGTNGPAYIDGGSGDDWSYGTDADDVFLTNSGTKKIRGYGGDDLIVASSRGLASVDGGAGTDTISYATHTPTDNVRFSGVRVELDKGTSLGQTRFTLDGIENVIGSSFDDEITGVSGEKNIIEGGLGNDTLIGQERDGDTADGGLGNNVCQGFVKESNCNRSSPGDTGSKRPLLDINEGGVLTLIGSRFNDKVSVGYSGGAYRVSIAGGAVPSGLCVPDGNSSSDYVCPALADTLNGMLLYGNDGDDDISLDNSIPRTLTTTINGGAGKDHLVGGRSKDYISTSVGNSAGSVIEGRDNLDVLYINDDVKAYGGNDGDAIHIYSPCIGGESVGGKGKDSTVFAGADHGVKANIARGYAKWVHGGCAKTLKIHKTIEKMEGTAFDDILILGKRLKAQQGKSSLLGRQGKNILNSKNGVRDTVTTGPEAHANKVISDRKDKVIWGWGFARF